MDNENIDKLLEKKIEFWKKKLLDLSKRNNLINYRLTKSKSVKIIAPQFDTIIDALEENKGIRFIKKQIEEPQTNIKDDWLCSEDDKIIEKKLYNLYLKFNENEKELGIQTCFVALGVLKYKEAEYSDKIFISPIFLFPVSIERLPKTYREVQRFEIVSTGDAELNPVLKEKLHHDYKIDLKDFQEDEEDIHSYIQYLKKTISGKEDWELSQDVYLDIFSYQKHIMYNDLIKYKDIIKNSSLVRALVGDSGALENNESDVDMNDFGENFNDTTSIDILPADSSQKKAIELAHVGATFVLQGPPGTGKSQTIVNIIANSIQEGKKVLFVSQKMAALDVVQKRLEQAGFGNYCLNLHAYKGNKKEIVQKLSESLDYSSKIPADRNWLNPESYLANQQEINEFYKFLCIEHGPIKRSVYDVRGEIAKLHDVEFIDIPLNKTLKLDETKFSLLLGTLRQIDNLCNKIPDPLNDILLNIKDDVNTPLTKMRLKEALESIALTFSSLYVFIEEVKNETGFKIATFDDLNSFINLEYEHKKMQLNNAPAYLVDENYKELHAKISELYSILKIITDLKSSIEKKVDISFITLDTKDMEETFKTISFFGKIFGKKYRKYRKELKKYGKTKIEYKEWLELFELKNKINDLSNKIDFWAAKETCLANSIGDYENLEHMKQIYNFSDNFIKLYDTAKTANFPDSYKIVRYIHFSKNNIDGVAADLFKKIDELNQSFEANVLKNKRKIKDLSESLTLVNENFDNLNDILIFKNKYRSLPVEIHELMRIYFSKENIHKFSDVFLKSFYFQLLTEFLKDKNIPSPKQSIRELRAKDHDIRNTVRHKYIETIEGRKPRNNFTANGSETAFLKHESQKKRRIKPIREILNRTSNLAFALRPCFMMSPLTVSQYIDPESIHFDIIIFDEASQIMPEDAVVCLARANQAVIMGDNQQLPPTSFFMRDSGDNEEYDDIEDLDSFLKEVGTKLRSKSLEWHYRSKSEDLIAFSNRSFYHNRLITFPDPEVDRGGLKFIYVEDGIYDRGHSKKNKKEAERIVEIYKKEIRSDPTRSIGIVAFSMSQENAIREALEIAHIDVDDSKDPNEEGLFVKNLETVQGDERDIVILSIGYGKDSEGKFSYNFGPLNRNEGYKRLNVAITRSRFKTIVVSSILPENLDGDKINSESGVKYLKNYLDYAKNKHLVGFTSTPEDLYFDSSFEEAVYDSLAKEGFNVSTQIGCSGYRIDLAIKHPENQGKYILGIECDGSQYHSSRYARDRDKIRQNILEGLGWNIHRIWSDDWLNNRSYEIEKIKTKVHELEQEKECEQPEIAEQTFSKIEQIKRFDSMDDCKLPTYPKYEFAKPDTYGISLDFDYYGLVTGEEFVIKEIKKRIMNILRIESPVEKEFLYKRILNSLGVEKKGRHHKNLFLEVLEKLEDKNLIYIKQETISFAPIKTYYPFRMSNEKERPFVLIPKEELAKLIIDILKNEFSISVKDLAATVAKITHNNRRVGKKMERKMLDVIQYLIRDKIIEEKNGWLQLTKQ